MYLELLVLLLLIILNAFFAASEIALISLNDNKIRLMAEEGDKKAGQIRNLLIEPSKFLATIQIGITFAGFLASAFAAESFSGRFVLLVKRTGIPLSDEWLSNISVVLITIILSYFSLVLGELVPKRLAMKRAESISRFAVGPLRFLYAVAAPFVKLLTVSTNAIIRILGMDPLEDDERITEEEIRIMVDAGQERGSIHLQEKQMIDSIFEFNNKTVTDIMTHRTDIVALPARASLQEVMTLIQEEKYSRIPIYEENIDNIIGILNIKDLFRYISTNMHQKEAENFRLRSIIRHPYAVPSSKRTDELFREMQKYNTHMAVIIDEYGGTAGIVTMEDLVEEIMGNILDEYDDEEDEQDFNKIDEVTYIISGTANLDKVNDLIGGDLPVDDYETLSGFIIGQIGEIPNEEDKPEITYNGLVFKVMDVKEKRIERVKVCRTNERVKPVE